MAIRSDKKLYQLLEEHMSKVDDPLTCSDLMEVSSIREEALNTFGGTHRDVRTTINKLSDILGFMWRKGVLTRFPSPRTETSFARFAYKWADAGLDQSENPLPPPVRLGGKQQVNIQQTNEGVEIEFDKFFIVIRPK